MASFTPKKINMTVLNGGQRYNNGDVVSAESVNAPIEGTAYAQSVAEVAEKKATIIVRNVLAETGLPTDPVSATAQISYVPGNANSNLDFAFCIPQGKQGRSFSPQGEWGSGATYIYSDDIIHMVLKDGSQYAAKISHLASTVNAPPNSEYWQIVSSKGDTGDTGATGDTGETGLRGPTGGGSGVAWTIAPYNATEKCKEVADIVLLGDESDSDKINGAIQGLGSGGEIKFLEGQINCFATINMLDNITITGQGGGTLFVKHFHGILFSISDKAYTIVQNIKINAGVYTGYNVSFLTAKDGQIRNLSITEGQQGIEIKDSERITVSDCRVTVNLTCIFLSASNYINIGQTYCAVTNGAVFNTANAANKENNYCQIFNSVFIGTVSNGATKLFRFLNSRINNCKFETTSIGTSLQIQSCIGNSISNNIIQGGAIFAGGKYNLCSTNITTGKIISTSEPTTIVVNNIEIPKA